MRQIVLIILFFVSLLLAAWCGWAWHRSSYTVLHVIEESGAYPRRFPFPDALLLALNDWYDARYPAPLGFLKLHGEWPRVRLTILAGLIASSVGCVLCLAAVAVAARRRWRWLRNPVRCSTCGYDLTGNTSGICPECGEARPRVEGPVGV